MILALKIYFGIGIFFYFYLFAKQLIPVINMAQVITTAVKYTVLWPYYIFKFKDILKDLFKK